jgi:hypothetical protein
MSLDEQAVRAAVRAALGGESPFTGEQSPLSLDPWKKATVPLHPSHYRYALPESDGPCLIEPTVQCTHCGYCQSHGH